jgi:hypothetical protein
MELITLSFNQDQLMLIDRALQQLPYIIAAPLISNINQQLSSNNLKEPNCIKEESCL